MQTLPKSFIKNTFRYEQVDRTGDVAIYSQTIPELSKLIGYEVFEVKKNPPFSINGHDYPAKETVPSSEQWGKTAFTYFSLKDAKQKQRGLLQRVSERAAT